MKGAADPMAAFKGATDPCASLEGAADPWAAEVAKVVIVDRVEDVERIWGGRERPVGIGGGKAVDMTGADGRGSRVWNWRRTSRRFASTDRRCAA